MAVERKLIREHKRRVQVREFLHRETERAGFGGADIQRTPMGVRINLTAERPGFVIGRRGATIKKLTTDLQDRFDLDNPQVEVSEDPNPSLNSQIMAQKLAEALERGWHFRRAGHSTLRRIMESGAKGALIIIAGKLTGGRKRTEKFLGGHIKWCGDTAVQFMSVGYATAKKKLGIIGVTVKIMDPNARLPDEVEYKAVSDVPTAPAARHAHEGAVEAAEAAAAQQAAASEPAEPPASSEILAQPVTVVEGIGPKKAEALKAAGFETIGDIAEAELDDIAEVEGVGPKLAKKIKDEVKKMGA